MPPKKQKKDKTLPDKFIILACPDKKNAEKWFSGRSLANFPCSSRILLAGRPDSGKSTVIKNILLHAEPLYERLIVVCCTKETKDYDLLEPHLVLDKLPSIESFDRRRKNCLIIDDYKPKTTQERHRWIAFLVMSLHTVTQLLCMQHRIYLVYFHQSYVECLMFLFYGKILINLNQK